MLLFLRLCPLQTAAVYRLCQRLQKHPAALGNIGGGKHQQGVLDTVCLIVVDDFIPHRFPVLVGDCPRQTFVGSRLRDRIRNVEQIPQCHHFFFDIQYRDAVRTALDLTTCFLVPVFHIRNGCCGGILAVNQQLVGKVIVIGDGRCVQKCFPALAIFRNGLQLLLGKRTNVLKFSHGTSPYRSPLSTLRFLACSSPGSKSSTCLYPIGST